MQAPTEALAPRSPIDRWRPWLDAALVLAIVAIGLAGLAASGGDGADDAVATLTPTMAVVAVAATLPVLWRRRWPLAMLGVSSLAVVAGAAVDERGLFGAQVAAIGAVLLFAVGAWSTRRWVAVVVVIGSLVVVIAAAVHDGTGVAASFAYAFALIGLPVVLGYAARIRRQYVAEVEARLAAAERDRDERARSAVAEERQRLARELHDVVAHHVSLIGVQAGTRRVSPWSAHPRRRRSRCRRSRCPAGARSANCSNCSTCWRPSTARRRHSRGWPCCPRSWNGGGRRG